ncbi:MAG TPA: DMT family transporter [Acidobacteriaceae bacterium]|jgi:transporter family-2 protein
MLYIVIAMTGFLIAIQAGCNATLEKSLQNPVLSAFLSFCAGTAALLLAFAIYAAITRTPMPRAAQWSSVPWWGWVGGALGAIYILCMVLTAEKVGSGIFVGLTVTATIVASLVMDHYGLLGFKQHPASPGRILGGALMVAGMLLIGKF